MAAPRSGSKRELAFTTPILKGAERVMGLASGVARASQAAGHSPVSRVKIKPMNKDYFFCGVGGSGMLPLAMIVQAQGNRIAGSDRALDQGRTPDKFDWLRAHGVTLGDDQIEAILGLDIDLNAQGLGVWLEKTG